MQRRFLVFLVAAAVYIPALLLADSRGLVPQLSLGEAFASARGAGQQVCVLLTIVGEFGGNSIRVGPEPGSELVESVLVIGPHPRPDRIRDTGLRLLQSCQPAPQRIGLGKQLPYGREIL